MTDVPDRPWTAAHAPRRILAIRLQALGDVVATLPYLQALRRALGCVEIDFLTRRAVANVPANLVLFRRVYWIGGRRRFRYQLLSALLLQPLLLLNKYDVVVDLQNNRLSRFVRRSLRSTAWSSFDRFSPLHAGERTRRTIRGRWLPAAAGHRGASLEGGQPRVAGSAAYGHGRGTGTGRAQPGGRISDAELASRPLRGLREAVARRGGPHSSCSSVFPGSGRRR